MAWRREINIGFLGGHQSIDYEPAARLENPPSFISAVRIPVQWWALYRVQTKSKCASWNGSVFRHALPRQDIPVSSFPAAS